MQLSVLGFGCGAVGGFMVRGDPAEQERVIARAIAAGVNYFDTAVQYGNGESEKNLGRVLRKLKPANVAVGTKVRVPPGEFGRISDAVTTSLEGSLASRTRPAVGPAAGIRRRTAMMSRGAGAGKPRALSVFGCWCH
jgi:aryl-alcohol dehydrogenase-like predicted oxidoreductase